MANTKFVVKYSECKPEEKNRCLTYLINNRCCREDNTPLMCKRILDLNPLCYYTSNNCTTSNIGFIKADKDVYVVFSCPDVCKYFLKGNQERLLSKFKTSNIIYGKELDKLLEKYKQPETKSTNGCPEIELLRTIISYILNDTPEATYSLNLDDVPRER